MRELFERAGATARRATDAVSGGGGSGGGEDVVDVDVEVVVVADVMDDDDDDDDVAVSDGDGIPFWGETVSMNDDVSSMGGDVFADATTTAASPGGSRAAPAESASTSDDAFEDMTLDALDVDVTSASEVRADGTTGQLLAALDLAALAVEVASDVVGQSRALEMTKDLVEELNLYELDASGRLVAPKDRAEAEEWKVLKSLRAVEEEAMSKRRRVEEAQRELLDGLTELLERK